MSLLTLLLVILIIGLLLSAFSKLDMPGPFKNAVYIVVCIVLILWLFEGAGAIGPWHSPWRK